MQARRGFLAAAVGVAVLFVAALRGRLRRYAIAEQSMAPTLENGDWTVARRLTALPRRGSVVVFPHPDGRSDMDLVKRVVGLPGEHVTITNGQVHIDDSVLAEPWADGPTLPDGEWTLGPDQVFVLGDARSSPSVDSRVFGPVDAGTVEWEIGARYWPLRSIGRL